jgi:hypothetical protein
VPYYGRWPFRLAPSTDSLSIKLIINMLMPAPMIVLHIHESYWYSKHRGIGLNLASVADGQSYPSLG